MDCNLQNIAERAKERFPESPFPHKKDEYWRFADLNAWNTESLFPHFANGVPTSSPSGKLLEVQQNIDEPNTVAIFDGQSVSANLSSGLSIMQIGEACQKYPCEVSQFYESAIGKFDIASETVSPDALSVGDPCTLTLKILGTGNFKRMAAPSFVETKAWKTSYKPKPQPV